MIISWFLVTWPAINLERKKSKTKISKKLVKSGMTFYYLLNKFRSQYMNTYYVISLVKDP